MVDKKGVQGKNFINLPRTPDICIMRLIEEKHISDIVNTAAQSRSESYIFTIYGIFTPLSIL